MTGVWAWLDRTGVILVIVGMVILLSGCDPVTTHKITSTIFDGVPSMPTAEEYCSDYHQKTLVAEVEAEKERQRLRDQGSATIHPPYKEKRCNDCHDKNSESGFVTPTRNELCAVCHPNFIKGAFVHGPAAVGSCLKCHSPHNSQYEALLVKPKSQICSICHAEQRAAAKLHETVAAKGMICTDCHNPHSGNSRFFLE